MTLVLSRQKEQGIIIGHDIIIRVVEIRGNIVRLGIDAPKSTPVHREEIYAAKHGAQSLIDVGIAARKPKVQ